MKIVLKSNIPVVQSRLLLKQRRIGRAISRSIRKAGLLVERTSKQRSPVDTGRMRSSIRSSFTPLTATIKPNVNYAIFVHDGTSRMRGRPFMTEGLKDAQSDIVSVFEREIKGSLR